MSLAHSALLKTSFFFIQTAFLEPRQIDYLSLLTQPNSSYSIISNTDKIRAQYYISIILLVLASYTR